jgi:pyruvate,water dikinase
MPVCGGKVRARVRVLESVMEAHKLEKGNILVTRQTDPGWVLVFPLISGLIVERGGMLSHGAIVSREFGIPAIVGVHEASSKIPDGAMVLLDADTGFIEIINE